MTPDRDAIEAALLRLIGERAPGKTLDPTEAARALGGDHPDGWGPLMQPIRRVAVALAEQGRIVIVRKGKPVDPADFKGVDRVTAPRQDCAQSTESPPFPRQLHSRDLDSRLPVLSGTERVTT